MSRHLTLTTLKKIDKTHNKANALGSKKRRFALLFAAGDLRR